MLARDPEMGYTPLGDNLHVVMEKAPDKTPGGLWLPDEMVANYAQAIVIGAGPGERVNGSDRAITFCDKGDTILFQQNKFQPFSEDALEGSISESDVVAIVDDEDEMHPMNDWVMLAPPPAQKESDGGIILPEDQWGTSDWGIVIDWGPGMILRKGPLAGARASVLDIIGVSLDEFVARKAYWAFDANVIQAGGESAECLFVKAHELITLEGG